LAADEPAAKQPQAPDTRGFTTALQSIYLGGTPDAAAPDYEAALQNMFRAEGMPGGILQAVSCHDTACKLDLRWTLEHDAAYHRVTDRLQAENAKYFATYADPPDATGAVNVTAYWRRSLSLEELRLDKPAP
jgi:hypothetical protein